MEPPFFAQLDASGNLPALIEFNRQRTRAEYADVAPRPVRRVGIVGAGTMGAEIGAAMARHGISLLLTDTQPESLASVVPRIAALVRASAPTMDCGSIEQRIRTTADIAALGQCDLVLESVVEDPAVKQRVFGALEPHLADGVVLASNTSTIPVARLGAKLASPGRFCGVHFFHPVGERPLVEVIPGPQTQRETMATAIGFVEQVQRIPLVVPDGPAFLVNRFLMPYLGEAMQLLMEGASIEAIDQAAEQFGMALGPLRLVDEIGLDTALDCAWSYAGAFPDAMPTSPLLVAMVKAKRLGRKSGAGFYAHRDAAGKPTSPRRDPAAEQIIARWAGQPRTHTAESIAARLFLTMLLEATRMLQTGFAPAPQSIDLGLILGLAFPRRRGGLLWWADALGADRICGMLRELEWLGPRVQPTPLLVEMAQHNRRFYPDTFA